MPGNTAGPRSESRSRGRRDETGSASLSAEDSLVGRTPDFEPDAEGERMRASLRTRLFGEQDEPVVVGKYRLLDPVGEGGMGTVYRALDPDLDRVVALKVLRDPLDDEQTLSRLVSEARALARLSHPNVVAVHDVGHGPRGAYLAMELVEGEDLLAWTHAHPRRSKTRTRVLHSALLGVGAALEAAHALGIVHRDVKPSNVLLGADGRVRLGDFGLARGTGTRGPTEAGRALPTRFDGLTRTGAWVGTPAYMAPEQFEGIADPRSDQFSFCVTMYEAFCGRHPFAADTLAQLRLRVQAGALEPPAAGLRIPHWLRALLRRGLSADPRRRYPDMGALLAAAKAGPWRRRAALVLGPLSLLALGTSATLLAVEEDDCAASAAPATDVWGPRAHDAVHDALVASGAPHAESSWSRVEATLDAVAQRWSHQHVEACTLERSADPSARERAPQVGACLVEARRVLDFAIEAIVETAREHPEHIATAVLGIDDLTDCGRPVELDRGVSVVEAFDLSGRVARGELELELGRAAAAAERLDQVIAAIGERPLHRLAARARGRRARAAETLGDEDLAQTHARAFLAHAELVSDPALEAEAWLSLSVHSHRDPGFRRFCLDRVAQLEQRGELPPRVMAEHALLRGAALAAANDDEAAIAPLEDAVEAFEALGDPATRLSDALSGLGDSLLLTGSTARAVAMHQRATSLRAQTLGTQHPATATGLVRLAQAQVFALRYSDARASYDAAIEVLAANPDVAPRKRARALAMRAQLLTQLQEHALAIADSRRSYEIQRQLGASDPRILGAAAFLVRTLVEAERHAEALDVSEPLRELVLSLDDETSALSRGQLGLSSAQALIAVGRTSEGVARLGEAALLLREVYRPSSNLYYQMWATVGRAYRAAGRTDMATSIWEQRLIEARTDGNAHEGGMRLAFELATLAYDEGDLVRAKLYLDEVRTHAQAGDIDVSTLDDVTALAEQIDSEPSAP